jgi:hypothetical protein
MDFSEVSKLISFCDYVRCRSPIPFEQLFTLDSPYNEDESSKCGIHHQIFDYLVNTAQVQIPLWFLLAVFRSPRMYYFSIPEVLKIYLAKSPRPPKDEIRELLQLTQEKILSAPRPPVHTHQTFVYFNATLAHVHKIQ